jgi:hypothetical protein
MQKTEGARLIAMQEEIERLRVAEALKREAGVRRHLYVPDWIAAEVSSSIPADYVIQAPLGNTEIGLAVLSHEAGHVATQPPPRDRVDHDELVRWEFAASQWGFDAIRRHGGEVTPYMQDEQRRALRTYTDGLNVIPTGEIAAWLNGEIAL